MRLFISSDPCWSCTYWCLTPLSYDLFDLFLSSFRHSELAHPENYNPFNFDCFCIKLDWNETAWNMCPRCETPYCFIVFSPCGKQSKMSKMETPTSVFASMHYNDFLKYLDPPSLYVLRKNKCNSNLWQLWKTPEKNSDFLPFWVVWVVMGQLAWFKNPVPYFPTSHPKIQDLLHLMGDGFLIHISLLQPTNSKKVENCDGLWWGFSMCVNKGVSKL